ncbi:MAG: carbohydrate binding domain-containing protein, partial [Thermodesulfovibrionales bacterium]|nr:carbohydrate binding domain-containing protein [Thermodesulfovibrionales bacterium]
MSRANLRLGIARALRLVIFFMIIGGLVNSLWWGSPGRLNGEGIAYAADANREFEAEDDLTVSGQEGTKNDADLEVKGVSSFQKDIFVEAGILASPYGGFGAYQNLLSRSEELNDSAWTKTGVSINVTQVTAPDGATTADQIDDDITGGGTVTQTKTGLTAGDTYTFSIWLKDSNTIGNISIQLQDNGTTPASTTTTIDPTTSWKRYSVTHTLSAGSTQLQAIINHDSAASDAFYAWGAQLEKSTTPGVYVQTESTAVSTASRGLVTNADLRMLNLTLGETGTMTFGDDTNLYRTAANTLKTDDALTVTGNLIVNGATTLGDGTDNLTVNTNQLFVQGSSGNVGIGTTNPLVKFHIVGQPAGNDEMMLIDRPVSSDYGSMIVGGSGTGFKFGDGNRFFIGTDTYANRGAFTFGTELVTVLANGNVGIGTTSPGNLLNVYDGSPSADEVLFNISTNAGTKFIVDEDGDINTNINTNIRSITISGASGRGIITPWLANNDLSLDRTGTGTLQLGAISGSTFVGIELADNTSLASAKTFEWTTGIIDSNGNVGIGTVSPSQKLHVEGQCVTGDTELSIFAQGVQGSRFKVQGVSKAPSEPFKV